MYEKMRILEDRERRLEYVRNLVDKHRKAVIVIKCNICGDNKNPSYSNFLRNYFLNKVIDNLNVQFFEHVSSYDGDYYCVIMNDNTNLKSQLVEFENSALGRLIDLDLYLDGERSVSRRELGLDSRKCIICGNDVVVCTRERMHTVEEVNERAEEILKTEIINIVVDSAYKAIISEVTAHPKFGLVTKKCCGKHKDMNYDTFIESAKALKPFLYKYAYCGFDINDDTFNELRRIGVEAEKAMFEATRGVNTHKGTIFLLGFLIPALVDSLYNNKYDCKETIKFLSKDILNDFNNDKMNDTKGFKLYHTHNITGVRGEVKEGLKLSHEISDLYKYDEVANDEIIEILLHSMSKLNDTVILHHKDIEYLDYVKEVAASLLKLGTKKRKKQIEFYTEQFIKEGVSPGGSADIVITVLTLIDVFKKCGV